MGNMNHTSIAWSVLLINPPGGLILLCNILMLSMYIANPSIELQFNKKVSSLVLKTKMSNHIYPRYVWIP